MKKVLSALWCAIQGVLTIWLFVIGLYLAVCVVLAPLGLFMWWVWK